MSAGELFTTADVELSPWQTECAQHLRAVHGDDIADRYVRAVIEARHVFRASDYRRAPDRLAEIAAEDLRELMLTARDGTGARRRNARARLRELLRPRA